MASSEASSPALDVNIQEEVSQVVAYDQTLGEDNVVSDTRGELGENDTGVSRTGVSLQNLTITGSINISNVERVGNTTLVSINITINGTENISSIQLEQEPAGDYFSYNISTGESPVEEPRISIFIAELRANHSAVFNFSIDGVGKIGEPLNFTEEYSSWRVMTGRSVDITLNATNSLTEDVELYDISVYKTPEAYPRAGGGYTYFNFSGLTEDDSGNATIYLEEGKSILNWNISGGVLSKGDTRGISFVSLAPENISANWYNYEDWATWMRMGNITASFKFNSSVSGMRIEAAEAKTTELTLGLSKDRMNESHWNATLNMSNTAEAPLDYNVSYISIWATKYQTFEDPGNISNWINNTNVSAYGFSEILGSYANVSWIPHYNLSGGDSTTRYSMNFNYSLVPIVWSNFDFFIMDDGTQISKLEQTVSKEDGYLFIEEIYVLLGGYLVKATKSIEPINYTGKNNSYAVNITIENVGTQKTPEWITMFDLLPKSFHPLVYIPSGDINNFAPTRNMTENAIISITSSDGTWSAIGGSDMVLGAEDSGEISSGPYEGYWGYRLDLQGLNATSDGDGYYDSDVPEKEIGVRYKISGNHTLSSIENAYIIGVDPIRLEGANPSRSVASGFEISSDTAEYLVIMVSLLTSIFLLTGGLGLIKKRY